MSTMHPWERCRHYRSMAQYRTCEAGVVFDEVRRDDLPTMEAYPCFRQREAPEPKASCPLREWPTDEEVAEVEARVQKILAKVTRRLEQWKCAHCEADVLLEEQSGRFVVAHPCGHVQRMGTARGHRPPGLGSDETES